MTELLEPARGRPPHRHHRGPSQGVDAPRATSRCRACPIGKSGKFRKVLREQIPAWLEQEAGRAVPTSSRPRRAAALTPAP